MGRDVEWSESIHYANVLERGKHSNWIISKAFYEGRVDFPKWFVFSRSIRLRFPWKLNFCLHSIVTAMSHFKIVQPAAAIFT